MNNNKQKLKQMNKQGMYETLNRALGFVVDVNYTEGSDLVYVIKRGGLSVDDLEKLGRLGLKLRYLNPTTIKNKYSGEERSALQISLEVV